MQTTDQWELDHRYRKAAIARLHLMPWNASFRTYGYAFCIRHLGPQLVADTLFNKRMRDA